MDDAAKAKAEFNRESQELLNRIPQKNGRTANSEYLKVKLKNSRFSDIPVGSVLDVTPTDPARLAFGEVVCFLQKKEPSVGRFLFHEGEYLVLSMGTHRHKQRSSEILGKVMRAESNGRDFDPNQQNPIAKVLNRMTMYGTRFAKESGNRLAAV